MNRTLPRAALQALRERAEQGRPWGDAAWVKATAARLGVEFTLRGVRPVQL